LDDHFLSGGILGPGFELADADAAADADAVADAVALALAVVVVVAVGLAEAVVVVVVVGVVVAAAVVVALEAGAPSVFASPPQATIPITPPMNPRRTMSRFMGRHARMKRRSRDELLTSNIEVLYVQRVLFDELPSRLDLIAHQQREDLVRLEDIVDANLQ
jgi:hypothetical protein